MKPQKKKNEKLIKVLKILLIAYFAVVAFGLLLKKEFFGAAVFGMFDIIAVFCFYFAKPFVNAMHNLGDKINQKSENVQRAIKILQYTAEGSLLAMMLTGLLKIDILLKIFFIMTVVLLIPFYITIFLRIGIFNANRQSHKSKNSDAIITFSENKIRINNLALKKWMTSDSVKDKYQTIGILQLNKQTPVIYLYEGKAKTAEFCLQKEKNEDFSGKKLIIRVCISCSGKPALPVVQIVCRIEDTDISYRLEGQFLKIDPKVAKERYELVKGRDLVEKGLKYPGYSTPLTVRLVGICSECKKSFTFYGYEFCMTQNEVAYSDDGLDICVIDEYIDDVNTWELKKDGKTFRYYNSFCCPHCGEPYIDYKKYKNMKYFGVSGCTLIGKQPYYTTEKEVTHF